MEKRYIWFDSGWGFTAASIGSLFAAMIIFYCGLRWQLNMIEFGLLAGSSLLALLWPAFVIDRRARRIHRR
jgi:hypothetical protein